ncbi:MAG: class II aldolase [Ruminococcaceae bacterium]|nr:class II aldolase [Oscillospiraceae bacterium]
MKDFVKMCAAIGGMKDYVQGGGGNASCKHDANKMAIKASGFTIGEITKDSGYADVDYIKICEYHTGVKENELAEREKNSTPFTMSCVFPDKNGNKLRPSVETGFHSFMKKYVMHTHPVYANAITCASGGAELAKKILGDADFIWIPYINPGFSLTLVIKAAMDAYEEKTGIFPKIIFLENHGLITTSDDAEECLALHFEVNEKIKAYLGAEDFVKSISLSEKDDAYICEDAFVSDFVSAFGVEEIERSILYPDQLVYLNAAMKDGKIAFSDSSITINAPKKEALAIVETFAAFCYVVKTIKKAGLTIQVMDNEATGFINNWESEKYRKSVASQK